MATSYQNQALHSSSGVLPRPRGAAAMLAGSPILKPAESGTSRFRNQAHQFRFTFNAKRQAFLLD
jgi:hypothetical protein